MAAALNTTQATRSVTGNRTVPPRGAEPSRGGGIYVESGNVRNSIIYFNSASSGANWYWNDPLLRSDQLVLVGEGPFAYCCTTPDPGGVGVGNIVEDPQFVDPTNGNYRLVPISPCIDAGLNEEWMHAAQDLDGNPRIDNGTVDLGAWETKTAANSMPAALVQIEAQTLIDAIRRIQRQLPAPKSSVPDYGIRQPKGWNRKHQ